MGAGDYPAGEGPAGHDPTPPAPIDQTRPLTAKFEMFDRVFPLNADGPEEGQFQRVHPVDHEVSIRVGIRKGSVAAAKDAGIDVDRIKRAPREALESTINDVITSALRDMIDNGDVELIGTPLADDANGRPFYYVDYKNLRLPMQPRRRIPVQR